MVDDLGSAFRVSPVQKLLWTLPGRSWVQSRVRIRGELDGTRVAAALGGLVQRHESLRTRFRGAAARTAPVQVVDDDATIPCTELDAGVAGFDLETLCRRERELLDAGSGPVLRVLIARDGPASATVVVTGHAMATDRASVRLLLGEFLDGCAAGPEHAGHVEPPMQYADAAAWFDEILTDEDAATHRVAWADRLRDLDRCEEPQPDSGPAAVAVATVPADVVRRVERIADLRSVRPDEVVAAAFLHVTSRLRGQVDVAAVMVREGRPDATLVDAIGPYERLLPLAVPDEPDLGLGAAAAGLAHRVRAGDDDLVHLDPGLVGIGRQVLIDLRGPDARWEPGALRAHVVDERAGVVEAHAARFTVADGAARLALAGPDGPAGPPAANLARLVSFLAAASADPDSPMREIDLLDDDERARVATGAVGPEPASAELLLDFVVAAAERWPDRIAVDAADRCLTYAEVVDRSTRFAARLRALGVASGDRIALSVSRRSGLVVGMLGILQAGGAFVPVDPAHPRARLATLLADCGAVALVVDAGSAPGATGLGVPTVDVDQDVPDDAPPGVTGPRPGPGDPAYVMYTSGTSGRPKGVRISHGALANYLSWCADAYRMAEGSGAVVASSISFDFTLTTLLAPLTVGQRVLLLDDDAGMAGLAALIRAERDLAVVKLTPTHLDVLNQLLGPDDFRHAVRTVVLGGEALRAESLGVLRAAGVRIVNEYGPTETVVGSVVFDATHGPSTGPVPVGVPIAGTSAHVLDRDLRPVPDGVPGEICIGGRGVADGYLGDPELTDRLFPLDPFAGSPSARIYRTGDRGLRRPDGTILCLGRTDEQLTIRGVRIEPGEVVAALVDHPAVAQAAVTAHEEHDPGRSSPLAGERTLVGYVVRRAEPGFAATTADDLLEHCRTRLPAALVPAAVMLLDALPVTGNGKLDRAALPRPHLRFLDRSAFVAPRTPTEEVLAAAIATVVGLDRIGVDDNYFALGGDSIRSVMVASRAQARGVDVTVSDLHDHPTIRDCAAAVDARPSASQAPGTEPFGLLSADDRSAVPADVEDAFPLSLLQEGMIFHRDFAEKSAVYHALASVRLRAPFDAALLAVVVRQLVERHPMLRTSFDLAGFSRPLQLVHRDFVNPLEVADLRGLPVAEQERRVAGWVEEEKALGFELQDFPLIRFMAHRLTDEVFQFTYGFHHEIVDGWSEALMITELFSHYFSVLFDDPIVVRSPRSGMRDAIALELAALEDPANHAFWDGYLADATLMRLPRGTDGPRADKGAREIVRLVVPVSPELSDGLQALARSCMVPLKSVLMAGHLRVMSAYGGGTDTLTYTVTNGRPESIDGSTAVGLFVNSLAQRVAMPGGTWRELVESALRAEQVTMPYRRLPMAELKRHQGNEPLAETLFFFTDYHVFEALDRWRERGVEDVAEELYAESTFPFCGIFRLNRDTRMLEIRLEYDCLQFSAELLDSMAECYLQTFAAMIADPEARYDVLPVLSGIDRARNDELDGRSPAGQGVEPRADRDVCLHEMVAAQAAATPDAVAVRWEDSAVSYAVLAAGASALAARLSGAGVAVESVVGVLTERSVEMVTGLLGVLGAGAAYLPLDPSLPAERLSAVLRWAAVSTVVTQQHLAHLVPDGVVAIVLDERGAVVGRGPTRTPATTPTTAAAYVMMTSGSTGEPKAVVVEHRAVVASLRARTRTYGEPVGSFLLLSSFAFDSSVAGIFWTLGTGGTLILPGEGLQLDPLDVIEAVERHRPTHTLAIPSLLVPMLTEARGAEVASLAVVIAAGEPCPPALWHAAAAVLPHAALHNEYGPTECAVWSTEWSGVLDPDRTQVPIGRPVDGYRVSIRNAYGTPAPTGVAGELHIGGPGLARGYLGRPALTASRFSPCPREPGARTYASGDLVRVLPDGDLDFLGRTDQQVKIRGHRVELGEVETVLDGHPGIRRSIVVAHRYSAADTGLVAYLLPQDGAQPEQSEVQQYVRSRLPRYMVPTRCVVLDTVPLTATGKVDRASLPVPGHTRPVAGHRTTRTGTEQAVAAIWCRVLQIDGIGPGDHFFDLGGESLRAMQAVTAVNHMFRIRMSVRALFDTPELGGYCELVDRAATRLVPVGDAAGSR